MNNQLARYQIEMNEIDHENQAELIALRQTLKMRALLNVLLDHLYRDIPALQEPQAAALFEASAEALSDILKEFDDYEKSKAHPENHQLKVLAGIFRDGDSKQPSHP